MYGQPYGGGFAPGMFPMYPEARTASSMRAQGGRGAASPTPLFVPVSWEWGKAEGDQNAPAPDLSC